MGNPRRLKIYAEMEGDDRDERRLHAIFRHQRIAGEWFLLPAEVIRALRRRPFDVDDLMTGLGGAYAETWAIYKPARVMDALEILAREGIAAQMAAEGKS